MTGEYKIAQLVRALQGANPFEGRTQIVSDVSVITEQNIKSVLENAVTLHNRNAYEIEYLYNYFRGNQPVLNRFKKFNADINNKVVENHAYEAVAFRLSYEFAYPVRYVSRGEPDKSEEISNVERFLREANKYTCDGELAQWLYICGVGYRFALPNKGNDVDYRPLRVTSVDPRKAFVIYTNDEGFIRPCAGVLIRKNADGENVYNVYTNSQLIVCDSSFNAIMTSNHVLGQIPLIEYRLNPERMGVFEPVMGLLDGINTLDSNRIDAVEAVVQSILVVLNADVSQEDVDNAGKLGIMVLKGVPGLPADAKALQFTLSQEEVQIAISHLYDMALTIMGLPDRQSRNGGGGDTGAAVSLRNGWSVAEARALSTERFWNESEREFLRLIIRICKDIVPEKIGDLKPSDADIKFTRNLSDNLLVKTQALTNLISSGMAVEPSLQAVGLVSDYRAVSLASPAMHANLDKLVAESELAKSALKQGDNTE